MGNASATKDRIITQAMSLFNTKGFRATSLSDITKAAGITKGAIYGNFANKDDVAVASFDYAVNLVVDQLRARIKAEPVAPLKLKAIVHYYEDYVLNPPIPGGCPIINTSVEADDNYPQLRAKVIRTIAILKGSIIKIVHRGIREGQLIPKVDVEAFSTTFYAAIEGGILLSRVEGDAESYRHIRNQLLEQIDQITIN